MMVATKSLGFDWTTIGWHEIIMYQLNQLNFFNVFKLLVGMFPFWLI